MYESHFGFRRKPFRAATPQSQYFGSRSLQRVLGPISYCLKTGQGIALLTGPAGIGKSTVLRHLVLALENSGKILLLPGVQAGTPEGLLSAIAAGIASEPQKADWKPSELRNEVSLRDRVVSVCHRAAELWGPTVVLIDDAHVISDEVFHELRFLSDCLYEDQPLFRIGLAGTLQLEEKLTSPTLRDFGQRVRCHQFLESLRPEESIEYLKWHIESVGGKLEHAFDSRAIEFIIVAADGVPRCLNQLADESLLLAYYANETVVDLPIARTALESLRHLPLEWAEPETELETATPEDDRSESHSVIEIVGLSDEPAFASETVAADTAAEGSAVVEFGDEHDASGERTLDSESVPSESQFGCVIEIGDEISDEISEHESDAVEEASPLAESPDDLPESVEFMDDRPTDVPDVVEAEHAAFEVQGAADDEVVMQEFSDVLEDDRRQLEELLAAESSPAGAHLLAAAEMRAAEPSGPSVGGAADHWAALEAEPLSLEDVNSIPIYDRFTWNALNREFPVSTPRASVLLQIPPSQWPPEPSNSLHGAAIPVFDEEIEDPSQFTRQSDSWFVPVSRGAGHDDLQSHPEHDAACQTPSPSPEHRMSGNLDAAGGMERESGSSGYPSPDWLNVVSGPEEASGHLTEDCAPDTTLEAEHVTDVRHDSDSGLADAPASLESQSEADTPVFGTLWRDRHFPRAESSATPRTDAVTAPDLGEGSGSDSDSEREFFTLSIPVPGLESSMAEDEANTDESLTASENDAGVPRGAAGRLTDDSFRGLSTAESEEDEFSTELVADTDYENTPAGVYRFRQDSVSSTETSQADSPQGSGSERDQPTAPKGLFSDLFTRIIERSKSEDA